MCGGGERLKRLANECGAEKDTHKKGASASDVEEVKKLLQTELSCPPRAKKEDRRCTNDVHKRGRAEKQTNPRRRPPA